MNNPSVSRLLSHILIVVFTSIFIMEAVHAQQKINPPSGNNQQLPGPINPPNQVTPKPTNVKDLYPCGLTVKDASGNVYNIVQIGTQCWMKENLRTTQFRTGESITELRIGEVVTPPFVSKYVRPVPAMGLSSATQVSAAITKFGLLYNLEAIRNPRGICPAGWHVPSKAEFETLINFLGGEARAGGSLKSTEAASNSWTTNVGATNSSGFTALPDGRALSYEDIVCCFARYWTTTPSPAEVVPPRTLPTRHLYLNLVSNSSAATFGNSIAGDFGSCRCIKD